MTISFGGLVSNLPVNDIIEQLMAIERRPITLMEQNKSDLNQKQAQMDRLSGLASTLLGSVQKITQNTFSNPNLLLRKTTTTSAAEYATATADTTAASQDISLKVHNLATATKASSVAAAGQVISNTTPLNEISGITSGNVSVYVNGTQSTVAIDVDTQTLGDLLTALQGIAGITSATVDASGKVQLQHADTDTVQLGGTGDTSKAFRQLGLTTGIATSAAGTTTITSSVPSTLLNLSGSIEDNLDVKLNTAVTAGSTFTIGGATFDVTGKTMNDLMTEINGNAAAGAVMSYNRAENKFQLFSKETGSNFITLEDTSGNFLQAIGLIDGGGNSTTSQTLGTDAMFELNGGIVYSESNTVTEAITGLTGVTLNLLQADGSKEVKISVKRDETAITKTVQEFVDNFNKVMTLIDQQTNAENNGLLANDSTVRAFKEKLRQITATAVGGLTQYTALPFIGISTGTAGSGGVQASSQLQFDSAKLIEALNTNEIEVTELIKGTNGVFTNFEDYLDNAINEEDGLFMARKNRTTAQIDQIDESIAKAEERLTAKEQMLKSQFTAMEKVTARFQSQGSAISSLASQLSANRK